ncbi:hypothetical protein F7212_02025 [Helicobacter pylori]|nr:hypothetical protein [Helicobacter pylori]
MLVFVCLRGLFFILLFFYSFILYSFILYSFILYSFILLFFYSFILYNIKLKIQFFKKFKILYLARKESVSIKHGFKRKVLFFENVIIYKTLI